MSEKNRPAFSIPTPTQPNHEKMMQNFLLTNGLDTVRQIAVDAGTATLQYYGKTEMGLSWKSDDSPLTHADLAANQIIVQRLKEFTPDIPILSEESAEIPFEQRQNWTRFWLIDPLDGTREFIHHRDEFTVNIALIENGIPVLGVVRAPVLELTFSGSAETGAWKEDAAGRRAIRTSGWEAGAALRIAASRSHAGEELQAFLNRIPSHTCQSMGSSLKLCLVAEGAVHLYPRLGPTMEWDTAAADAIVRAAGGQVTATDQSPLQYNKTSLLNPFFIVAGKPPFPWWDYLRETN